MTTGTLDRRMIVVLVVGVAAVFALRWWVTRPVGTEVVEAVETVPAAEKRLERVRQAAAAVPGRETLLKQVNDDLAAREKGVIQADTTAQAQAQILDTFHRLAQANGIDARGAEQLSEARPLGNDYGEVTVTVPFSCAIEQLVNFLAALPNEPMLLATNEITINGGNDKKKNINVRLSISGVVPRKLVPVKKGPGRS